MVEEDREPPTVLAWGIKILRTGCAFKKSKLTLRCQELYNSGQLPMGETCERPPLVPARPPGQGDFETTGAFTRIPKQIKHIPKKVKLVHSLCHIESYAVDLSWDILVRFASDKQSTGALADDCLRFGILGRLDVVGEYSETKNQHIPLEFFEDWLRVAGEEAKHFQLWADRLVELGYKYGDLPCHDGLWEAALITSHDLLTRLAILHMMLEGEGLDRAPKIRKQMLRQGDNKSADILEVIERDEITHVASGVRWFKYFCEQLGVDTPVDYFKKLAQRYFYDPRPGYRAPPFNTAARTSAGMTKEWYL